MSYRLLDKERQIYIKEGSEKPLKAVEKIIFDFDGVLAQTSQSYRQTIRQVVDYYFLEIYIYKLKTASFEKSKKMILLR